jgi:hypothetical protein
LNIEQMFDRVSDPPGRDKGIGGGLRTALDIGLQTAGAGDRQPVVGGLEGLLSPRPGRVVGLLGSPGFGLTRLGLKMLADPAITGPVAYLDVRGWLCPPAAWEAGIDPQRLVVVRCDDPVKWGRVAATVIEGVGALYAEVPRGLKDQQLRKLESLARSRRAALLLRPLQGALPSGLAFLRLTAREVAWQGTDQGHGRLTTRRLVLEAAGKAVHGMSRLVEVEDHGADDLHLVSRLAAAPAGRAAG